MVKRRQFSSDYKAKVALEAIHGELTLAEIAKKYEVHPNMVAGWKRLLIQEAANLFVRGKADQDKDADGRIQTLHAKIGRNRSRITLI